MLKLKQQLIAAAILSLGFSATAAPNYFVVTPALSHGSGTGGQGGDTGGTAPQPSPINITLSTGALPNGIQARAASPQPQGTAYTPFDLKTFASVSGGTGSVADVVFSLAAGSLPQGLTLSASGVISGTPGVAAASQTFTIAGSYQGATSQQTYTINIDPAAPQIALNTATLPEGTRGEPYSFDFKTLTSATGGTGSIADAAYSIAGGSIPVGLSLSSDGMLGGTPSATTPQQGQSFTIKGSYQGADGQQVYTIKVGGAKLEAKQIAGSYNHTCVITTADVVMCWGYNAYGQLGNGNTINSNVPVEVTGLPSGVNQIATNGQGTCAITAADEAWCWGYNSHGQLGNGNTTNSNVPVKVTGLLFGVKQIEPGVYYTCALATTGAVWCWGYNGYGQLGNGNNTDSKVPVKITGLPMDVKQISVGDSTHSCALTTAGEAWCWGYNAYGQLGTGNTISSNVPVKVTGLPSGLQQISAAGNSSCALAASGEAWCWGNNSSGQLGNGNTINSNVPVKVTGLPYGVKKISTNGGDHTCVLTTAGEAWCWGNNTYSQLGNGNTTNSSVPTQVIGLTPVVAQIVPGFYRTCALTTSGQVWCWGNNSAGQLGNGTFTSSNIPVQVIR